MSTTPFLSTYVWLFTTQLFERFSTAPTARRNNLEENIKDQEFNLDEDVTTCWLWSRNSNSISFMSVIDNTSVGLHTCDPQCVFCFWKIGKPLFAASGAQHTHHNQDQFLFGHAVFHSRSNLRSTKSPQRTWWKKKSLGGLNSSPWVEYKQFFWWVEFEYNGSWCSNSFSMSSSAKCWHSFSERLDHLRISSLNAWNSDDSATSDSRALTPRNPPENFFFFRGNCRDVVSFKTSFASRRCVMYKVCSVMYWLWSTFCVSIPDCLDIYTFLTSFFTLYCQRARSVLLPHPLLQTDMSSSPRNKNWLYLRF
jgi:hypothetical protein